MLEVVVTRQNLHAVVETLYRRRKLGIDSETTGLRPYHGDRIFSLILCDGQTAWYFNFNHDAPDFSPYEKLDREEVFGLLAGLFRRRFQIWYTFNAKFELAMLLMDSIDVAGVLWDAHVGARLEKNNLLPDEYNLESCAARIGERKDSRVMDWIIDQGLYALEPVPGKRTKVRLIYMDQVIRELIVPYACRDAWLHYELGERQRAALRAMDRARAPGTAPLTKVVSSELALTKTTFHMEHQGVHVDRAYCERAIEAMGERHTRALRGFEELTGRPLVNSSKCFAEVFAGESVPKTPTGRPSYEAEVMETLAERHPAARLVLEARAAKSDLDFYNGFLYHCDDDARIHTHLNSAGTATGRFSSSSPNLQNLRKVEGDELKAEYVVRRAIVPPPGACFVMHDMDQAEYRLMLDYAGARRLIEQVLGGLDVHQATAVVAGITRPQAKTANFATLYGSGLPNLAFKLGVPIATARAIREAIFTAAPEIRAFISLAMERAELRGYVTNWLGRRCLFDNSRFAYRAPNAIIQGGVADVVKVGMNVSHRILAGRRSRLALNIHDELVFIYYPEDFGLIPEVHAALQAVYRHRYLPLTWGVDHSWKSLADKVDGLPMAKTTIGRPYITDVAY